MTAAIVGEDLFLIYRTPHGDVSALRGLDLTVAAGEHVAVLGPSGAGKSSLLALCSGFARPSSGRLSVAGTSIEAAGGRRLAALRREKLGIVRQPLDLANLKVVA
jgi:putative ABC transport system ATP-binding protein